MRAVVHMILILYGTAILVAVGGSVALVLVMKIVYAGSSPGIGAVVAIAGRFLIPLIVVLCLVWASVVTLSTLWRARRQAVRCGLTFLQYFDLSQEDRERRVRALGEGGWEIRRW